MINRGPWSNDGPSRRTASSSRITAEVAVVEEFGDQCCDCAAFGLPERYMGEEFLAPECIDDRDHTVVATNMKVVSLGNVVREYHSAVLTEPRERSEEHTTFEVLRFVDDHECIVQATAANMSER